VLRSDVQLSPDRVKALVEQYYAMSVHDLTKVRAAYKVSTPQGVFAFKNARKLQDLSFVQEMTRHLKERGFTRIPDLLPAGSELLIRHLDEVYYMEEWLTHVREVSPKQSDWLEPAGDALARFHLALADFPRERCPKKREVSGEWPAFLDRHHRYVQHLQQVYPAAFDIQGVLAFFDQRFRQAQYWDRQSRSRGSGIQGVTLCHGSLHHENIMLDKQQQVWLIDFERMARDARVKDLAQLMQYHFPRRGWPWEEVQRFLQAYMEVSSFGMGEGPALLSRMAMPLKMVGALYRVFPPAAPPASYGVARLHRWLRREQRKEGVIKRLASHFSLE
jgi:Ser/Thr protein kinase RdoA (MazF antagonist)